MKGVKMLNKAKKRLSVAVLGAGCGALGLAVATTLLMPTATVLAAAGSGSNGGGIAGCQSTFFLATCYGATWRWYAWPSGQGNNDLYIKGTDSAGVGAQDSISPSGYISRNCKEAGGYWRYAMVAQNSRWGFSAGEQVGISALNGRGIWAYKSEMFGGGMNYRGSNWSQVKAAFDEAQAAGFNSGFQWNGNSSLGWFCYGDGVKNYDTTWESDTSARLSVGNKQVLQGTSARASKSRGNTTKNIGSYEITPDIYNSAKITWNHNLYRVDNEKRRGEVGYYVTRGSSNLTGGWKNASLNRAGSIAPVKTYSANVKDLGLKPGTRNYTVCESIYHDTVTKMTNDGSSHEGTGSYAQSQACVSLSRPFTVIIDESNTNSSMDTLYIGENGGYNYKITFESGSSIPSEPVDIDGDGELETPPPPRYSVLGMWVDVDGVNSGGNFLNGGTSAPKAVSSGDCGGINYNRSVVRDCTALVNNAEYHGNISGNGTVSVPDNEAYIGAKYCIVVTRNYFSANGTFQGYENGANNWGIEQIACSPTYKKPNFRVTGAQAYTGGGVSGTITKKVTGGYDSTNKYFGSWSEYNLAAGGTINGFSTGAFPSFGASSDSAEDLNQLTVANANLSQLGNSGISTGSETMMTKLDNYIAKIKNLGGLTTVNQGGLNFSCSSVHGICFYEGDSANITGNITAGGAYPIYVVRTNGNIEIAAGVTFVDAWLISTSGNVNTCSAAHSVTDLTHYLCNQALTINGPVYGNSLSLMRTAGANGVTRAQGSARLSDAESAETINFPAKTYVWAYEESVTSDVRLYETGSMELAPRV